MHILQKNRFGCPFLILAPMEGLGDRFFRRAMASIGGFDETCTEFMRVPANAHVQSLAKQYRKDETAPIPQAAQLMGSDPELMAAMAQEVVKRGAHRIDLNCGCPSNTVTGRGAGSSLLKDPSLLHEVAKALVKSVDVPVTAKLRSGYQDTSLFKENLLAAQESGVQFITLHPRTKVDGYSAPANWELIRIAKELLKVPVVGNGDILNVQDALRMLNETGCDALMIGRGSVINPWIFQEIRAHFEQKAFVPEWRSFCSFMHIFLTEMIRTEVPQNTQLNKIKQLMSFFFKGNDWLLEQRIGILSFKSKDPYELLNVALPKLKEGWRLN